jgi:hypothetical protein
MKCMIYPTYADPDADPDPDADTDADPDADLEPVAGES